MGGMLKMIEVNKSERISVLWEEGSWSSPRGGRIVGDEDGGGSAFRS